MAAMERGDDYALAPGRVFLNHGSFGATPRPVLDAANALRREADEDFPAFYHERVFGLLESSRRAVCAYLGVPEANGVFVRNSTTAMQTVVDHLALSAGDHVVTTSREYEATRVLMRLLAGRGVDVETVDGRHAGLVERVLGSVGPRTRAVVVSHVTSPWSSVNDVDALSEALSPRGVVTVVDGAHTAGMLPMPRLRPGVFVCLTLHKWLHLPRGAGFLVVPPDAVGSVRPVVTSWYADDPALARRFAWAGTDDVIAHLVGDLAVAHQRDLEDDGLDDHREKLTTHAQDGLLGLPGDSTLPTAPRAPAMVAVRLPAVDPESLLRVLHGRDVDLWCGHTPEGAVLRLSVAPYTTAADVDHGLAVLEEALAGMR
jgi:isopenicillin-N epimerase